jgi:hypothetical protein
MFGARGSTGSGVTGEIVLAEVRFGLNDDSAGDAVVRLTFEHGTEHVARNDLSLTIVEITWQNSATVKRCARPRAEQS